MLSGRGLQDSDDAKSPHVAVINQAMAKKFWPDENPVGKRFLTKLAGGQPVEVVGVVPTGKYKDVVEDPPELFFYVPLEQEYMPLRAIHVRTSVPPESLQLQIESQFRELVPGVAVSQVQTMRQALEGVNGFFFFRFGAQLAPSAIRMPISWVR